MPRPPLMPRTLTSACLFVLLAVLAPRVGRADDAGDPPDASVLAPVEVPKPKPTPTPKEEPKLAPPASTEPTGAISIGDRKLCTIHIPRGGISAEDRARRASRVLEQALEDGRPQDVRVSFEGATAIIHVGDAPLVQLVTEDAVAAGDASVSVHAESCAASVRQGLRTELRRRNIANLVFSVSLIVLSGLLAFLLLGVVSRTAARVTSMVEARETIPALKIGTLELLTPAAIRVGASTAIEIARPIVQIVILLGWLLSSMSLFPFTQEIGRRVTGYVLVPLTTFLGRIGAALPLLVLVAIGAFTLFVLLRFLRVFFDSVAQGGIHLGWLPRSQALPASVVARIAAVIGALLAAAPLLSSDTTEWGALRITGVGLTFAVVLALTPMFANAALGTFALFTARFQTGAFVEIGAHAGRLDAVTVTYLHISDRSGAEVRVPHLLTLVQAVRVLGDTLPSRYEIVVDARAPQGPIRKALSDAVQRQGRAAYVELTEIEGQRAVYLVVGMAAPGEEDLASAIADALTRLNVDFTRIRKLDAS